jgi:ankyrin repeat protein
MVLRKKYAPKAIFNKKYVIFAFSNNFCNGILLYTSIYLETRYHKIKKRKDNLMKRILFLLVCISLILASCTKKETQAAKNSRLNQAANDGDVKAVQAAISDGADVNYMDGETALMAAVHYGYTDVVKLLLEKGADVNAKTTSGINAMYIALVSDRTEVIKLLLSANVDVNAGVTIDGKVYTPLAIAKQKGDTQIIELLEKAGAKE